MTYIPDSEQGRTTDASSFSTPANGSAGPDEGPVQIEPEDPDDENVGEARPRAPNCKTRLLDSYYRHEPLCGSRTCNHGTFSPRPASAQSSVKRFGLHGSSSLGDMVNQVAGSGSSQSSTDAYRLKSMLTGEPPRNNRSLYVHVSTSLNLVFWTNLSITLVDTSHTTFRFAIGYPNISGHFFGGTWLPH